MSAPDQPASGAGGAGGFSAADAEAYKYGFTTAVEAVTLGRGLNEEVIRAISRARGALSLALAVTLPTNVPFRPQIVDAVFAVVLFTLIVQGIALEPLLERLGFHKGSGGPSLSS